MMKLMPNFFRQTFTHYSKWPRSLIHLFATVLITLAVPVTADNVADTTTTAVIPVASGKTTDQQISRRMESIVAQLENLSSIKVSVKESVISLSGDVANESAAEQAIDIASRIEGAIAVEDNITRTLDLESNLNPLIVSIRNNIAQWIRALPLILTAIVVFGLVVFLAHQLANRSSLWSRLTPNLFLAQLLAQAIRVAGAVLGLVMALNILGATALMGTILGSAGVLGLAISFAVKDSMENYISSIMLSVRQPFRASDHVVINEHEGIVMRLTTRSTVLMTLDGNHLRIPNATVYKSVITNYSSNPQRRFDFVLGIDAEDDPADAMNVGLDAISELDWVLAEPPPHAIIETVGDSNILVKFMAWIDQRDADFGKARSLSIRAAKNALEESGFTLPEPIYRLRFDGGQAISITNGNSADDGDRGEPTPLASSESSSEDSLPRKTASADADQDVSPENHMTEQVEAERVLAGEEDLLDDSRPVE
tara:strand:+ start:139114 stop:140559 length:1446 start_codon:yes stop_codon:yes gene_type:complete